MVLREQAKLSLNFLDVQAEVGITKHMGGFAATNELLALCHVEEAQEVLDVGCGIGVGPAYLARRHDCRVVGADISERMLEWSHQRAREEQVEARVEFRLADVLELPFEAGRFDLVLAESVLAFVEDKPRAIRECVRVAKPGGYVGLNEGLWIKPPPPEMVARVKEAIGPAIPTVETWQTLWEASGLQERVVRIYQTGARAEIKSRLQWVGWRWALRAWGRALRLAIGNPAVRQSIKEQLNVPVEVFEYVGYGLFAGKK
jgi:ubiquinone/menaquinone biosynthesis C-methylase UbiE